MAQITYKLVGNAKLQICIPLVSGTKIIFVSDLMMMASAFARVLEAKDGSYQIHKIISESLDIAKAHFLDKLFITIYQRTMIGTQTSLIPASQYSGIY